MDEKSEMIDETKDRDSNLSEKKSEDEALEKDSQDAFIGKESGGKVFENDSQEKLSEKEAKLDETSVSAKQAVKDGLPSNSQGSLDESRKVVEDNQILKEGTVKFHGVNRILRLTTKGLILNAATDLPAKNSKRHREALEVPWQWVIWAELNSQMAEGDQKMNMTIHYIQKEKKKLRQHCIHLTTVEEKADGWIGVIQDQCGKVEGRPKKLLVVVNPIGGAGNARQLYQRKVAPVFQLAQIEAKVICTERSKHALEIGEGHDLSSYDSVIVVGGDGLYQEVLQGMTLQRQKSAGIDYNDVNSKFVALDKPIGIIPAGTGNGVANWLNGVKDIETSALRVLTGEIHNGQVFIIHSNGKFFCLCGLLFGYGSFGDMIKRTDELRWMKRARYPYCMLSFLVKKRRHTHCAVEYLIAPDSQADKSSCANNQEAHADSQWIKHDPKGKDYVGVFSFLVNPVDKGDHMSVDPFSDRIRLYLDTGCSTINLVRNLVYMVSGRNSDGSPPNLDIIDNVQGIRIKIIREESKEPEELTGAAAKARELEYYVDIDGECLQLEKPEMEIRLVPSFVPLYSCELE